VILNSTSLFGTGTSTAGSTFPGIQYLDIGLKVKATPRIHLNDEVTLQLQFDISNLSGQSINSMPIITNDTISQTVRVKENETTVVAGILQGQASNAMNGTPGIAAIPEIGSFEGGQNVQDADSELLILVTPRTVRYAPRRNHFIYAGQGTLDGPGNGPVAAPVSPQSAQGSPAPLPGQSPPVGAPPPTAPQQEPPRESQPTVQAGTPAEEPQHPSQPPQGQTPPAAPQDQSSAQPPPQQQ
jgi:general secretion pathway protein D